MKDKSLPIALTSAAMQEIYHQVEQVAPIETTVLITGDTGVGKEIIAHKIHKDSQRKDKPFKVINCSAFPDNGLLQSELFGHEKGAFTGAMHQREGVFEQVDTGTLFLDEIGEMSPEVQAMFLRVLEIQEFTRLGGNRTIRTDVRVVVATNKCLATAIKDKKFREDLYYRLNRFHIHIPPLRERREDILSLVDAFIAEFNTTHGKSVTRLTPEVRNFLKYAPWPGNIRQLRNVVERAIVLTESDELTFSDLPADIAIAPQMVIPEHPSDSSVPTPIPAEVRQILSQISVTEFILIFGGIPNAVWRVLPEKTQQSVIQEASFHLSTLLGGHQDAIRISGMDRNQILGKVAQRRVKEYGSLAQAAKSLGIDRRTLKTYTQVEDVGK
jgi:DNA-binding NtrC family response regulator